MIVSWIHSLLEVYLIPTIVEKTLYLIVVDLKTI